VFWDALPVEVNIFLVYWVLRGSSTVFLIGKTLSSGQSDADGV
jgi:hypothetical protein